jgi:hypothetical protein
MMMFIEVYMSSFNATNMRGKEKSATAITPFFALQRITFQLKITHLSKLHYLASLQAPI